jgi:putative endonuclease
MEYGGYVYIMASRRNGTIYIGVTSDLAKRAWEHREGLIEGFAKKYGCKMLVWFEHHDTIVAAIQREKQMKEWRRA